MGSIWGVVLREDGRPVQEDPVTIRGGGQTSFHDLAAQTNEKGEFIFHDLDHGTYLIGAGNSTIEIDVPVSGYANVVIRLPDAVELEVTKTRRRKGQGDQ